MGCNCNKGIEWYFEYEGETYTFESHSAASAKRRALGAIGKAPIRTRQRQNA